MSSLLKLRALLYLHALRTWRFKYTFINSTINMALWMAIFIIGALIFVPSSEIPEIAPYMFWGIILWTVLSSSVWSVGGWAWFILSLGMYEEHTIHNTSIMSLLSGRTITVITDTVLITPVLYFLIRKLSGPTASYVSHPIAIIGGLATMFVMALSYGLMLSAISFRIGVPGTLLDISNFLLLVLGGIAIPVSKLPPLMRYAALAIPFSYPSELTRYGATGAMTYLPLQLLVLLNFIIATSMLACALLIYRRIENSYLRKYGPRAIGRM